MKRTLPRIRALFDKGTWLLVVVGCLIVGLTDWRMLMTLLQWTGFGLVLGGVTIAVARVTFPQVRLTELVNKVKDEKDMAAAVVSAAIFIYCGLVFLGLVLWAK